MYFDCNYIKNVQHHDVNFRNKISVSVDVDYTDICNMLFTDEVKSAIRCMEIEDKIKLIDFIKEDERIK